MQVEQRPPTLRERVEQINDTADGATVSVIVQMRSAAHDADFTEVLKAASDGMRRRLPIVSARDILPPLADKLRHAPAVTVAGDGSVRHGAARLSADPSDTQSDFAYLSPLSQPRTAEGMAALRMLGTEALKPLWSTDVVKKTTKSATPNLSSPSHASLWTSSSLVLELSREDLKQLSDQIDNTLVAEIYPNRVLKVPPVQKLESIPPEVADNKASAWGLAKTGALAAWGAYDARGKGVKVAVLDTGVDPEHPDLKGKVIGFAEFTQNGEQKPGVGLPHAYDSGEHGTHCCGTVVGGDASGRWIGMAPEAEVLAGLVLKAGVGSDAQILAGMEWAIASGADVISLSLGGLRWSADVLDTYSRTIINANRLGIAVVIAVGNEGSQTSGSPGNDYFAFTVGATDFVDRAAGFSGGRTQVIEQSRYIGRDHLPLVYSKPDISAPGVAVYSALPGGGYAAWNGTSMATPHVAGAMALLMGQLRTDAVPPEDRPYVVQALLSGSVVELGESGKNHRFGYGRLDVLRALGYAAERGYLRGRIPRTASDVAMTAPPSRKPRRPGKPKTPDGGKPRRSRRRSDA